MKPRPASEQDRIDAEASAWIVRGEAQALPPGERGDLDAWLGSDPRHAETYREMLGTWDTIPSLKGLGELAPDEAPAEMPAPARRRLPYAIGAGAVAAALVAALMVPAMFSSPAAEHYATRTAETRQIMLSDGSKVTLGPRSALDVRFNGSERRVALTGGEAFFEVAHDSAHPFLVEAGPSAIRVVGTRFDVNHVGGAVRVAVAEGIVQVADTRRTGAEPNRLLAGQRVEVAATPAPLVVAQTEGARPGGWRDGHLVYENARLADLVADVNRYYAPGVRIAGDGTGDLRVSAAFNVTEIPAFLSALDGVVPVTATEAPGGAVTLRIRAEAQTGK